jgi:hypothetical protein
VDPILYEWVTVAMFALLVDIGNKKPGLRSNMAVDIQLEERSQQPQPQPKHSVGGQDGYTQYQQPGQAEVPGSSPPTWAELPYSPIAPQPQQQQLPFTQHQNAISNTSPVEAGGHPLYEIDPSTGYGGIGWGQQPSYHPPAGPQPGQVFYEAAGMPDQKN